MNSTVPSVVLISAYPRVACSKRHEVPLPRVLAIDAGRTGNHSDVLIAVSTLAVLFAAFTGSAFTG